MTNQERIIVSAYTGFLMCKFEDLHEYIEQKLDRPVFTHEMANNEFISDLRDKCKDDFLALCEGDDQ